jgi:hypothetical protein
MPDPDPQPSFSCRSALLALGSFLSGLSRTILSCRISSKTSNYSFLGAYLFISLFLVIVVLTQVIFVILIVIEAARLKLVVVKLLESKSFTREPINRTGNKFLLDILSKLVIQLQAVLDIRCNVRIFVLVIFLRRCGRIEEKEEGLGRYRLFDDAGLFRSCG